MNKFQLVFAAGAFFTGLVLAVLAILESRYWGAAGCLAAGLALAITILLFEDVMSPSFWLASTCTAALTLFSILDTFTSSHLVNLKEADAQNDFVTELMQLEAGSARLNSREKGIVTEALKTCVVQGYSDGMDMVVSAQKSIYFGPTLSLADGVNSALQIERPPRCLDYYRELRKTQPQLFMQMEKSHPWLLDSHPS
ncbi:hypothetical protein N5D52_14930 [Pseudomonas sp. GD03860]|uniref:hypothetical protein n=1 Tax=Pseudomonas TaxID=286 RepID=UPI002363A4E9|nr:MULTISPECIES: hypothetical protein [Pseudomonas]MDD2056566.1 hypothetical protein [Pseudomonas putida]MDH0638240.1 hypothetical protein [Pseudomonas sp. GD03860]